MSYPSHLLPTTVVGSYPQPDWLVDRAALEHHGVPRVHADDIWRVPPPLLEQAQDDATLLAIKEMERAGIDIVTDGEIRRESYSNRFALALDGIDAENPGEVRSQAGRATPVPRVVGPIRRRAAVERRDVEFLRANTDRQIRITLPGPFTLTQQVADEHYKDEAALAMDYAAAVNQEMKELFAAGADVVQLDEPFLEARADKARAFAVPAINRAIEGFSVGTEGAGTTALHLCFGYGVMVKAKKPAYSFLEELAECGVQQISVETAQPNLDCTALAKLKGKTIILGVLDLGTETVETAETVAARIRRALPFVPAERLMVAPDCGLKYLSREAAFGKLQALVAGAALVRKELSGQA